jgi:hypothetical protein
MLPSRRRLQQKVSNHGKPEPNAKLYVYFFITLHSGKKGSFEKDLFLTSVADLLEFPTNTEHSSLERAGLGLRCAIRFKESDSPSSVAQTFIK